MLRNHPPGASIGIGLLALALALPVPALASEPLPWPKDSPRPAAGEASGDATEPAEPAETETPPAAEESEPAPRPAPEPAEPVAPSWDPPAPREPAPPPTADPGQPPAPQLAPPDDGAPVDAPPHSRRNRGVGLMTSGFIIFGVTYLATAITGALLIDSANNDFSGDMSSYERAAQEAVGRRLLAPVLGPFLAIDPAQSASAAVGLSFVGVVQVTGLALGAGGIARFVKHKRQLQAGYMTIPGGGLVRLGFKF